MDPRRAGRVAEALREELAELIAYELADPRLEAVTVTDVQVSSDFRHARVRVIVSGEAIRQQEALRALEGARHYLRRELAGRMRLWRMPELHFQTDAESEPASRVEELLNRIRKDLPCTEEPGT